MLRLCHARICDGIPQFCEALQNNGFLAINTRILYLNDISIADSSSSLMITFLDFHLSYFSSSSLLATKDSCKNGEIPVDKNSDYKFKRMQN